MILLRIRRLGVRVPPSAPAQEPSAARGLLLTDLLAPAVPDAAIERANTSAASATWSQITCAYTRRVTDETARPSRAATTASSSWPGSDRPVARAAHAASLPGRCRARANGAQPVQLCVQPAEFPGQRRAARSGLHPLLLPGDAGAEQLHLPCRAARRPPRNPAGRSRLPSPGPPARSPGQGRPRRAAGPPSLRSRPGGGPARRSGRAHHPAAGHAPASHAGTRTDHLRPWYPCSSWITCWRTRFRSAPSLTSTCAATPSPSRIRPSRMCSVPM